MSTITLQDLKKQSGLTHRALGRALQCSASKASAIIQGRHLPTMRDEDIQKLAAVLGCTFERCWLAMCTSYNLLMGLPPDTQHERYDAGRQRYYPLFGIPVEPVRDSTVEGQVIDWLAPQLNQENSALHDGLIRKRELISLKIPDPFATQLTGAVAFNREDGGRLVRSAWIRWARRQPDPKPSWLVEWDALPEADKEADRCIWDDLAAPYLETIGALHNHIQRMQREIDYWKQHSETSHMEETSHMNHDRGN
jgi:plasmid maintenance system antidote protein VapI